MSRRCRPWLAVGWMNSGSLLNSMVSSDRFSLSSGSLPELSWRCGEECVQPRHVRAVRYDDAFGLERNVRAGGRLPSVSGRRWVCIHNLPTSGQNELALFDALLPRRATWVRSALTARPSFGSHWKSQVAVFEHILAKCREAGGRMMSIHSRRASGRRAGLSGKVSRGRNACSALVFREFSRP